MSIGGRQGPPHRRRGRASSGYGLFGRFGLEGALNRDHDDDDDGEFRGWGGEEQVVKSQVKRSEGDQLRIYEE
jgi:hypothetical protein